ncbi:hypothetical protein [Geomicrobium sp. JCM 19055]|uniref:hypothetical protein n=1 Tax=Geomicrobium sp. JCM 19055 TaxID=1460649 RepID=UPI00045EDBD7|nr:hypothetical protein JCM19055_2909 [Geomicrobium sp. JCM 19055]
MITDYYPSRLSDETKVIKREDPIIYNRGKFEGPLNSSDIDLYEKNGFLIMDELSRKMKSIQ